MQMVMGQLKTSPGVNHVLGTQSVSSGGANGVPVVNSQTGSAVTPVQSCCRVVLGMSSVQVFACHAEVHLTSDRWMPILNVLHVQLAEQELRERVSYVPLDQSPIMPKRNANHARVGKLALKVKCAHFARMATVPTRRILSVSDALVVSSV